MTTATTPRHSAKRAKGRAQKLWSDSSTFLRLSGYNVTGEYIPVYLIEESQYEQAVERMARAICKTHGAFGWNTTSCDQEWFRVEARAALRSIGIAAPRKERKTL